MQSRLRVSLVLVLSALFAGVIASPAVADTSDFTFDSFSADYTLTRAADGTSQLDVVETVVARFPDFDQNRGIIRAILTYYQRVDLETTVNSVVDENGEPVPFTFTDAGDFQELALGDDTYVRGVTTYVISYTSHNVVGTFADTNDDEFYWDVNGTGTAQPVDAVAATVHVDPSLSDALTGENACYRGPAGSTDTCAITPSSDASTGATLFGVSESALGPQESVTVAIGFTAGTFVQVPAEARPDSDYQPGFVWPGGGIGFPFVLLGVGLLGAAYALARVFLRPREPKGRGTVIAQYSVPAGLNLLEAADLIGRPRSAMAAQIVSFAVRGKVRILDYPVSADGGDYTLQLLSADGVDDQELALLATFFPGLTAGAVCELGVTNDNLARGLAAATADATTRNIARGWRARPALTRARMWLLTGLGALVVIVVALLAFGNLPVGWRFPLVAVAGASLLVAFAAARRPVLLSAAGVDQRDYLTGMKVYLELAEADRFRMLQSPEGALRVTVPRAVPGAEPAPPAEPGASAAPAALAATGPDTVELVKLYEKLLPFAVLWGVEKEWAAELAVYYDRATAAPDWFLSQNTFSGIYLASALNGIVDSVHTTETPTPTPSSWSSSGGGSFSGGSFGGGFSGGGGGGGGGGGR